MVGVPRTHSARLLLLNLVVVGIPWMSTRGQPTRQLNPRSLTWSLGRYLDLEFRQLQYASKADASRTRTCVHI